jgi:hypothetical protein
MRSGRMRKKSRYAIRRAATSSAHYNPDDPASAALKNPRFAGWPLLVVAVLWFAVAVHASAILGD